VHVQQGMLHVNISDDGCGFTEPARPGHVGLRAMRERATSLGGECDVETGPDGTRVHAIVPLSGRSAVDLAVEGSLDSAPADCELDALRRERDSLVAGNERQRATIAVLGQRLEHTLAFWATLDDASLDMSTLLQRAARHGAEVCRDGCSVRLLSADSTAWEHIASWHPDPVQHSFIEKFYVTEPPAELSHPSVAMRGNAAVLLDRRASTWSPRLNVVLPSTALEPNSAIIAPIRIDGAPRGVLTVVRDMTETRFTDADIDLVQHLADRLGATLHRRGSSTNP